MNLKYNSELSNKDSVDYGTLAMAHVPEIIKYEHYCTSDKCCSYVRSETTIYNKKADRVETHKKYGRHNRKFKFEDTTPNLECPDCGHPLVVK